MKLKKSASIFTVIIMTISMAGCNASFEHNGKKIFDFNTNGIEQKIEKYDNNNDNKDAQVENESEYSKNEVINAVKDASFELSKDGEVLKVYQLEDIFNSIYTYNEWDCKQYEGSQYIVAVAQDEENGVVFYIDMKDQVNSIQVVYLVYEGQEFEGDEGMEALVELTYKLYLEENGEAEIKDEKESATKESNESKNTIEENKGKNKVESEKEPTDFDDRYLQEESQKSEEIVSKYHCTVCDKPYFPEQSTATDNYSFCCAECENHWNEQPGDVAEDNDNGIDHSKCANCGNEIGLNGYEGYCYDCAEKLGIGR